MAARRLFVAGGALVALIGVAAAIAIARSGSGGVESPLASLIDLENKGVLEFEDEHLFLVYNDGDPLALSDDPQHLPGEQTEWCESSQEFETPTHGEKFDRLGNYYAGPAAKGLDRYPVRIDGDAIYVDLNELIPGPERGAEKPLEPQGPFCVYGD